MSLTPALLALRGGELASYHGVEHKAIAAYEQDSDAAGQREHDEGQPNDEGVDAQALADPPGDARQDSVARAAPEHPAACSHSRARAGIRENPDPIGNGSGSSQGHPRWNARRPRT